jgi:hypothetical protein
MDVKAEIEQHALPADKIALLWLFNRYHLAHQWDFVAQCDHVRYGQLSYQTHRVWKPTREGVILYKARMSGAGSAND